MKFGFASALLFKEQLFKGVAMQMQFFLNAKQVKVDAEEGVPLLWLLRDDLKSTGTKYGCGMGLCGACTVHIDGKAARACMTPASAVSGKRVTTIEGLSANNNHPVQRAWQQLDVPQCGYCQSGQIMGAASLLRSNPNPTDAQIAETMNGHLCRCATYGRIEKAVKLAVKLNRGQS
jgi:isoquinoline 1-oxidoreductase subunit alpha